MSTPLAILFGFIYMQLFWQIAPIPSIMYPAVSAYWPVTYVIPKALWITGQVSFGIAPMLILSSFIIGTIVHIVCTFTGIPFSLISAAIGTVTAFPVSFLTLLGGIAAKVIGWRIGKEVWRDNSAVVAAGIFLGQSIVVALTVAVTMVLKARWILPY